jgi:hypothetical protein
MPLTIEDARFVSEMRLKIVENMQAEREPDFGIDKERLRKALDIVRAERSIGAAAGGKASKKASTPTVPVDLDALMGKKK